MVLAIKTEKLSLEDFLLLPETKPASEYIDGQIYQKTMPQGKHSILQSRLGIAINQVGEPQKIGYAFPELTCTFGGRSFVPDIAVFEWLHIPLNAKGEIANVFPLAPDWIIEILSPEQTSTRVINKILFCLKHKTKLGWLVDPEEKLVIIFPPQREPEVMENEDILPVLSGWEDLQLSVNDLFQWLTFK
jgi:Uma2 family endonuclease